MTGPGTCSSSANPTLLPAHDRRSGVDRTPQPSWNLITDVQQMWAYPFMVTALRAGTVVAVVAGVVGWVMVLRKESFAGHTLAVVGFPGAAAAAWLGVATGYGYFAACIGAAAAIALLPAPTRAGGLGGSARSPPVIGTDSSPRTGDRVPVRQPVSRLPVGVDQPAVRHHRRGQLPAASRAAHRRTWCA